MALNFHSEPISHRVINCGCYLCSPREMSTHLGGRPRIENLLRKNGFWSIFPIKLVKYSKYSPHFNRKNGLKTAFPRDGFYSRTAS